MGLKFAQEHPVRGQAARLGVDVYNLFNTDAAPAYHNAYTAFRLPDGTWVEDNPATPDVEVNTWGGVVSHHHAPASRSCRCSSTSEPSATCPRWTHRRSEGAD